MHCDVEGRWLIEERKVLMWNCGFKWYGDGIREIWKEEYMSSECSGCVMW